jgi:hypothetical protein
LALVVLALLETLTAQMVPILYFQLLPQLEAVVVVVLILVVRVVQEVVVVKRGAHHKSVALEQPIKVLLAVVAVAQMVEVAVAVLMPLAIMELRALEEMAVMV